MEGIKEEDLINIIAKWKNQKEFDINAGIDYYKFLEKYKLGKTCKRGVKCIILR